MNARLEEFFIKIKLRERAPLNLQYLEISGWFDYESFYDEMVHTTKNGALFVEVGVYYGRSVCYLGARIVQHRKQIKVMAVDLFGGFRTTELLPKFKRNLVLAGCDHIVTPLQADSTQAAGTFEDRSVDFCFLDASHDYTKVKRDIKAWAPKVKNGGILAGHDFLSGSGVDKAVYGIYGSRVQHVPPHVWKVAI